MALLDVLVGVASITVALIVVSLLLVVGISRLSTALREKPLERVRTVFPYLLFLGIVLGLTSALRQATALIQWDVGIQVGSIIFDIEGGFVSWIQSFQTPLATDYFAAMYIFGYVYLLVFPYLAYSLAEDLESFRELTLAYALNYFFGVLLYTLFIAFGPRNYLAAEGLLYERWSQVQLLTSEVNVNTNVFPSLHASLSTTVALFAVKTRDIYPRWPLLAVPLAISVCISTMYLGIHWAIDVLGGIILAALCVWGADLLHNPFFHGVERSRDWFVVEWRRARQWIRSRRQ